MFKADCVCNADPADVQYFIRKHKSRRICEVKCETRVPKQGCKGTSRTRLADMIHVVGLVKIGSAWRAASGPLIGYSSSCASTAVNESEMFRKSKQRDKKQENKSLV